MSPAVQEIDIHVQKLSLADQLWLMEKLTHHIREQIEQTTVQTAEQAEKYTNGSPYILQPVSTQQRDLEDETIEPI